MNKRLLAATIGVAAILVPAAHASFPPSPRVDSTVSNIAGRASHVVCYNSDAEWNARVSVVYHGAYRGDQIRAFTYPGNAQIEVGPIICRTLYYALRVGQSKVNPTKLGAVIDVLSHEPNHVAGVRDEAQAEACARRFFAFTTHSLFGVKYHTEAMRLLVNEALSYSRSLAPIYQGGACPR